MTCADCGKEVARRYARYCDDCRWRHQKKPPKWVPTEAGDGIIRREYDGRRGTSRRIAERLGWPVWAVKRRAAALGCTCPRAERRDWTAAEEAFLEEHAGSRLVAWIAKRLGRSLSSVVLKLKRMRISRRFREGYTLRDLELCFGVDHHAIERWVREGRLRVAKRGTARESDAWMVSEAAIVRFLRDHPTSYRLDRVDQTWFLELVRPGWGAALRAAGGDVRGDEEAA